VLGAISLAALNRWQMYSILRWAFTSPPGQKGKWFGGKIGRLTPPLHICTVCLGWKSGRQVICELVNIGTRFTFHVFAQPKYLFIFVVISSNLKIILLVL